MDTALIVAIIGFAATAIGLLFTNLQWRRDLKVKLSRVREDVTIELIRQRIKPYTEFFRQLEPMSSANAETIMADPQRVEPVRQALQDAVYGKVGLLASSDTRDIIIYARDSCTAFLAGELSYDELLSRFWLVHRAMRSDLGIIQRGWDSEVERVRPLIEGEREKNAKLWVNPGQIGLRRQAQSDDSIR